MQFDFCHAEWIAFETEQNKKETSFYTTGIQSNWMCSPNTISIGDENGMCYIDFNRNELFIFAAIAWIKCVHLCLCLKSNILMLEPGTKNLSIERFGLMLIFSLFFKLSFHWMQRLHFSCAFYLSLPLSASWYVWCERVFLFCLLFFFHWLYFYISRARTRLLLACNRCSWFTFTSVVLHILDFKLYIS